MLPYYVNRVAQPTGEHEVHNSNYKYLPEGKNRIYLGSFTNCNEVVKKAKEYYLDVDGCYFCSRACHTK